MNQTTKTSDTNYFDQVRKTISATLTPFHEMARGFINGGGTLTNAKIQYAGWVGAAQTNGSGPNADPVNSPWSFDSFVLGIPNLIPRGLQAPTGLRFTGFKRI
jgi:hypothetical protein